MREGRVLITQLRIFKIQEKIVTKELRHKHRLEKLVSQGEVIRTCQKNLIKIQDSNAE